jgi:3-oxoacyl-[acyl-carrier-protein] synthase-3
MSGRTAFWTQLRIGAFANECGERRRTVGSIDGFATTCASLGLKNFAALGCQEFWQMTQPVESYVAACVTRTLKDAGVSPQGVDYLILATADQNVSALTGTTVQKILGAVGLTKCTPLLLSFQQCASSLAALNYAYRLLQDAQNRCVVVAAVDFERCESRRLLPWGLYSDAVASCLVRRSTRDGLSLAAYAVGVDYLGIIGADTFESRKQVGTVAIRNLLEDEDYRLELKDIDKCFSTNLYKPLALYNASMVGLRRDQLYLDTMGSHAHCGNCDWMINVMHYMDNVGLTPRRHYLVQSLAPGFYACGLLKAMSADEGPSRS